MSYDLIFISQLNQEHSMKLAELQGTYCLLEEKTHYVTKLESTLQDIEQKQAMSKLKCPSRQCLIPQRFDYLLNNIPPHHTNPERRNRFLTTESSRRQKSKFSCNAYEVQARNSRTNIECRLFTSLSYKENPQEFILHANNLASYELTQLSHSSQTTITSKFPSRSDITRFFRDVQLNLDSDLRHIARKYVDSD